MSHPRVALAAANDAKVLAAAASLANMPHPTRRDIEQLSGVTHSTVGMSIKRLRERGEWPHRFPHGNPQRQARGPARAWSGGRPIRPANSRVAPAGLLHPDIFNQPPVRISSEEAKDGAAWCLAMHRRIRGRRPA